VDKQGTGKVIEWPIIMNIKKLKIRKIPSGFTYFQTNKNTDMWYTCTVGSYITSSAMLLRKIRVGQAVKKGYNILNCRITCAVVK